MFGGGQLEFPGKNMIIWIRQAGTVESSSALLILLLAGKTRLKTWHEVWLDFVREHGQQPPHRSN